MQREGTYLAPLLSARERRLHFGLIGLWVAAALWFWLWWLQPGHVVGLGRFAVVTVLIGWI
ncbi:MAG: hypothetical protein ACRC6I_03130, partial [Paracoccaceae bacterium]